jgi:hypothetical protein
MSRPGKSKVNSVPEDRCVSKAARHFCIAPENHIGIGRAVGARVLLHDHYVSGVSRHG